MAVDTFFVGHLKGIGKVYLQTAIDCCSRFAWGRLYTNKMPLTAVHLLNTDVVPHFEEHGVPIKTVLSDNGRECCGRLDRHPYELFRQLEGIEHRKTKVVRRPQSNGIVERFHRTLLPSTSASKAAGPGSRPSSRCRRRSMPTSSPTTSHAPIRAVA